MATHYLAAAMVAVSVGSGASSWAQTGVGNQPGSAAAGAAQCQRQTQATDNQNLNQPTVGQADRRARAQIARSRWNPNVINRNPWFADPRVRQDIGLNDEQFGRLQDSYAQAWNRYQMRLNNLDRNLTAQQRAARLRQLRSGFVDDFNRGAGDLVEERQRQRFNQLYFQYQGVNAFDFPAYQERFNLSSGQQQQLARLQQRWNEGMAQLSRGGTVSAEERRQRFNEFRQRTAAELREILTEEQLNTFQQMTGDPFDFSADQFFGTGEESDDATPGTGIGTPENPVPGSGIGLPDEDNSGSDQDGSDASTPGSGIGLPDEDNSGSDASGSDGSTPGSGIGLPDDKETSDRSGDN